jgi:alpha-acetolactate decarboxylase
VVAGAYTIGVSATGYTTKTVTDTVTDSPSVVNVSLVAVITSSVSGKVDSAGSATLVSGAIVTLRSAGAGGAVTMVDTTKADGAYSFAGVVAGAYTIGVSATGYTTKTVNDTVTATPSVVNVSLVAIVTSTVSGKVDSAGSATLVSGAIVTLRSAGFGGAVTTLRDTTKADGAYSFAGVVAGAYTIGVSATGYTTKTVNDTVTAAPSVVNVSLVAIVTSTVSGKVDSAGSATLVSGAIVTLRSSGIGGAVTTLRDTTKTDGTYSFTGVVTGIYTISVSATGYTTKNVTDTVTASASVVNVSLVRMATGIQENRTGMGASQQVSFVNGMIKLSNMSSAGSVRLVNAKGEMMVMQSFQPAAQVSVRIARNLSVGNYILSVTQDNGVIQKMIVVQ